MIPKLTILLTKTPVVPSHTPLKEFFQRLASQKGLPHPKLIFHKWAPYLKNPKNETHQSLHFLFNNMKCSGYPNTGHVQCVFPIFKWFSVFRILTVCYKYYCVQIYLLVDSDKHQLNLWSQPKVTIIRKK